MTSLSADSLRPLVVQGRERGKLHSLPHLERLGLGKISRLPLSLRIVLESLLRHAGGGLVSDEHVRQLAGWQPQAPRSDEIPFVVARIVAPDASGIPLLADLAAMRDTVRELGRDVRLVEPLVPVDLIVDHSLQVDRAGSADALLFNMREEFRQNEERYAFLKWAAGAFNAIRIVPPGIGIIHQVNIEQLARGVRREGDVFFPDTLVGTDSHTSMINGIGVLGWGVGGIEAEAGMLGQPVYFLTPDVVGVELHGCLADGITATDLVLTVTQTLRQAKVVGKFVEFFGEGAAALSVPDRCTISNMAPEYGATAAYFPVDEATIGYLRSAGRTDDELALLQAYFEAQGMFGTPRRGELDYSAEIRIDLSAIVPSVAGPRRPQDRLPLGELKRDFTRLFSLPAAEGGFAKPAEALRVRPDAPMSHGDVAIAAITSCSNTSNPGVLLAAGLLAKKAVERGLRVPARVKTSFTPGSRVVEAYLRDAGLLPYLDQLGFQIVGYGCATCMGNSGPLDPAVDAAIAADDLIVAAVLSGNRNFEARIHPAIKANYLMSPPLVVAFAIAGHVDLDPATDPLGTGSDGWPVYLRDIWPSPAELAPLMAHAANPEHFRRLYAGFTDGDELWRGLSAPQGDVFAWDEGSGYLRRPPFFDDFTPEPAPLPALRGARALAILGDSVTTDHVSPGSAVKSDSLAGNYLRSLGIRDRDFNSYIARRANHEVMMRGTFGNVRLRNLMVPGTEGGVTVRQPGGARMAIYDAAIDYRAEGVPLVVIAGEEYGTGSSRDWAAKGPALLGVRAVIARSFERIHRSNLVGMGILPCQFAAGDDARSLELDGTETFELEGVERGVAPRQTLRLRITRADGSVRQADVLARIDTPVEADYYRHGGILPYVLRDLLRRSEESPSP